MRVNEINRLCRGEVHPNVIKVLTELATEQAMQRQYIAEMTKVVLATLGGLKELAEAVDSLQAQQMDLLREKVLRLAKSHSEDTEH